MKQLALDHQTAILFPKKRPPYYSESFGRYKYDVSELFNFTSIYGL
jgi:uncharacterized membrane protein